MAALRLPLRTVGIVKLWFFSTQFRVTTAFRLLHRFHWDVKFPGFLIPFAGVTAFRLVAPSKWNLQGFELCDSQSLQCDSRGWLFPTDLYQSNARRSYGLRLLGL
jgi:hypothetical protein